MDDLHTAALIVHILSGSTALLVGTSIVMMRKGDRVHRTVGRVFFFALVAVSFSAFVLSTIRPNPFLFMVGVFTLYQGLGGYRSVKNKGLRPAVGDLLITGMGTANAVAMFMNGNVVLLVFGGISVFLVIGDIRTFSLSLRSKPVPASLWLRRHIGHMMGGYIATVTAFLVVNFSSTPLGLAVWFAPTVVGVPMIALWTRRYVVRPQRGRLAGESRMPE